VKEEVELVTRVIPAGKGRVIPGDIVVEKDSIIPVSVRSMLGWKFVGWRGDIPEGSKTSRSYNLRMDRDKKILAVFRRKRREEEEDYGEVTEAVGLRVPGLEVYLPKAVVTRPGVGHKVYKLRDPMFPGKIALGRRKVWEREAGRLRL